MRGFFGGARMTTSGDNNETSITSVSLQAPTQLLAQVSSVNSDAAAVKAHHDEVAARVLSAMTSSNGGGRGAGGFGGGGRGGGYGDDDAASSSMTGMPARGGNLSAVRGEEAFQRTLWEKGRDGLLVVKFGASWCTHCAGMLPEFGAASRNYPDAHFVLADVDTLPDTAAEVRYTPTFTFFNKGRKVDEITKTTPRGLRDHMWMHAPDRPDVEADVIARP